MIRRPALMAVAMMVLAAAGAGQPEPDAESGLSGVHVLRAPAVVGVGAAVGVRLARVEGAVETPVSWDEHPVRWFFVRTGAMQVNYDSAPVAGADGEGARGPDGGGGGAPAVVGVPSRGVALIGADLQERVAGVPGALLAGLARELGAAEVAEELDRRGRAAVRVRVVESAAVLIRAGEAGEEEAMSPAIRKSGQAVEIRPLLDPMVSQVGGDIAVRLYIRGAGLGGGRLTATALGSGRAQEVVTDRSGIGSFALSEPGPWRLTLRHLARSEGDDAESDWTLYSGTLIFEAGNGGKP